MQGGGSGRRVGRCATQPPSARSAPGRFATLEPMFIHRTTITGCSDRGAWPWRRPFALCSSVRA